MSKFCHWSNLVGFLVVFFSKNLVDIAMLLQTSRINGINIGNFSSIKSQLDRIIYNSRPSAALYLNWFRNYGTKKRRKGASHLYERNLIFPIVWLYSLLNF